MKRYMVFSWNNYYPQGGLNDLVESFDTGDEAIRFAKKMLRPRDSRRFKFKGKEYPFACNNTFVIDVITGSTL